MYYVGYTCVSIFRSDGVTSVLLPFYPTLCPSVKFIDSLLVCSSLLAALLQQEVPEQQLLTLQCIDSFALRCRSHGEVCGGCGYAHY